MLRFHILQSCLKWHVTTVDQYMAWLPGFHAYPACPPPPTPPTLPCPCLSSDIPGPMQCLQLVVASSLSPAGSASDSPGGAAHAPQGPACTHPNLSMFKSWDHFCLPLRSLITPCADLHTTPKRRYVLTLAVLLYADRLLTTCRVSGQQCKA